MQEMAINSAGAKEAFYGAYQKRMMNNLMREHADLSANMPRQSAKDLLGDNIHIEISADSQAFLDAARARRSAATTKNEAVSAPETNPFEGSSDLHKQYLVFSEYLDTNGFYDSLSDEGVRQAESLLRDITSSMDAISPNSLRFTTMDAPSHAAAQVAFGSSVEALHEFSDTYVPDTMKAGFDALISKFESYNSGIVAAHKNLMDRRDQALARLPKLDFDNYGRNDDDENAAKKLGSEPYEERNDRAMRDTAVTTFQAIRSGSLSLDSAVRKLEAAFYAYAARGSRDNSVTALLKERNQGMFKQMTNYWGVLLSSTII